MCALHFSAPDVDGRNHDPVRLDALDQKADSHNVRNSIQRPHLMEVYLVQTTSMRMALRTCQKLKNLGCILPYGFRQIHLLQQGSHFPNPDMPMGFSAAMNMSAVPGFVSAASRVRRRAALMLPAKLVFRPAVYFYRNLSSDYAAASTLMCVHGHAGKSQ